MQYANQDNPLYCPEHPYSYAYKYGMFTAVSPAEEQVDNFSSIVSLKYWLDDLYEDSKQFNEIAGNNQKLSLDDLQLQCNLLQEEVTELQDGITCTDPTEILDAAVDIAVVLSGLLTKLENIGMNVSGAMEATCLNNLSKYPMISESISVNNDLIQNTKDKYKAKGIEVEVSISNTNDRYVFRNKATGKILKPAGFIENDLTEFTKV